MKKILPVFISVLLFCCENNKPKTETTTATDSIITVTDKKEDKKDLNQVAADLEVLTPLDAETLKAKMPASVFGIEASSLETSSSTGALSADAHYKMDDSTSLDISILDCGGPAGSGFFKLNYVNAVENGLTMEDAEITKTEFNGHPAFELTRKNDNNTADGGHENSFTFFNGTRFLVNLNGKNLSPGKLKEAASLLKL